MSAVSAGGCLPQRGLLPAPLVASKRLLRRPELTRGSGSGFLFISAFDNGACRSVFLIFSFSASFPLHSPPPARLCVTLRSHLSVNNNNGDYKQPSQPSQPQELPGGPACWQGAHPTLPHRVHRLQDCPTFSGRSDSGLDRIWWVASPKATYRISTDAPQASPY